MKGTPSVGAGGTDRKDSKCDDDDNNNNNNNNNNNKSATTTAAAAAVDDATVGCITIDFAMQNVLLQIGIIIIIINHNN